MDSKSIRPEDIARCTEILEAIAADALLLTPLPDAERIRLFMAAGRVVHPEREQVRRRLKAMRSQKKKDLESKDRVLRAATSIRSIRKEAVFHAPAKITDASGALPAPDAPADAASTGSAPVTVGELQRPRDCYVCKESFSQVHFFYDAMCPSCARFNYEKRYQSASLEGRVAIITGARLKIGYHSALMMLRAGARVVVTTRFPQDAALRFAREADFAAWGDRLQVHGLDLRHSPSVEAFAMHMERTLGRLDILINNAAQTVRRPPGFYAHLMELESKPLAELPPEARPLLREHENLKGLLLGGDASTSASKTENSRWLSEWHAGQVLPTLGLTASAALSQIPYRCEEVVAPEAFPEGRLDADLQQVDRRKMNSWRMALADVPTAEMLEVQLVNSVAPFILCAKLKPLMLRDRTDEKHIVNVSAMEGKFNRHTKTDKHPHTNMAKAALNMMTLTSARDYVKSGIFMNAVDTGWVTDEDPAEISARKQEEIDFQPPLDIVDGAARVCDPFFSGLLSGKHSWGNFFKDYYPTEW